MSPGPPRRPFERSPRALAVPRRTQPRCRNRTKSSFPQSSPRALQVTVKRRNDGKDPPLRGAAASRKTPRVESGAVSRRDVRRPLPRRRSRPSDFASQSSPPAPPADAVVLPVPRRLRLLAGQRAAGKEDGGRRPRGLVPPPGGPAVQRPVLRPLTVLPRRRPRPPDPPRTARGGGGRRPPPQGGPPSPRLGGVLASAEDGGVSSGWAAPPPPS